MRFSSDKKSILENKLLSKRLFGMGKKMSDVKDNTSMIRGKNEIKIPKL